MELSSAMTVPAGGWSWHCTGAPPLAAALYALVAGVIGLPGRYVFGLLFLLAILRRAVNRPTS